MPKEQIFIGAAIAVLCALGIWMEKWFLRETRKGQRLVRWFGEAKAVWVLRGLFLIGLVFGILLAMNVIRPLQW